MAPGDGPGISGLPADAILRRMARHLQIRAAEPVGSAVWASAVQGYEECKREMDRRLLEHIAAAAQKQRDPFGLPGNGPVSRNAGGCGRRLPGQH